MNINQETCTYYSGGISRKDQHDIINNYTLNSHNYSQSQNLLFAFHDINNRNLQTYLGHVVWYLAVSLEINLNSPPPLNSSHNDFN